MREEEEFSGATDRTQVQIKDNTYLWVRIGCLHNNEGWVLVVRKLVQNMGDVTHSNNVLIGDVIGV